MNLKYNQTIVNAIITVDRKVYINAYGVNAESGNVIIGSESSGNRKIKPSEGQII